MSSTVGAAAGRVELSAELDDDRRQTERIISRAQALVDGLDNESFHWRPEPGRWSIGECLAHLNLSAEAFWAAIDAAIERSRHQGLLGDGPPRRGMIARWMLKMMEPPVTKRFKAPKASQPSPDQPIEDAAPAFFSHQNRLIETLERANGLDLAGTKARFPGMPLLRFGLGEMLAFVLAHERRHLWQAEQVRSHPDFPTAR